MNVLGLFILLMTGTIILIFECNSNTHFEFFDVILVLMGLYCWLAAIVGFTCLAFSGIQQ